MHLRIFQRKESGRISLDGCKSHIFIFVFRRCTDGEANYPRSLSTLSSNSPLAPTAHMKSVSKLVFLPSAPGVEKDPSRSTRIQSALKSSEPSPLPVTELLCLVSTIRTSQIASSFAIRLFHNNYSGRKIQYASPPWKYAWNIAGVRILEGSSHDLIAWRWHNEVA
jgi:hypothetical protein